MKLNIIEEQYVNTELRYLDMTGLVSDVVLREYGKFLNLAENATNNLLLNYFYLKKRNEHLELDKVLAKYNFNYTSSIHNAIYDLFNDKREALLWPGVLKVSNSGYNYQLKTNIGTINVIKASEFFKNTKSNYIFKRPLNSYCYERSYDFIRENRGFKAVLSYDDNLFIGGHYHAYLETDDVTLDIAANSLYPTKEDSAKVLTGKILKRLSYKEINSEFTKVLEEVPDIINYSDENNHDDKLQVLALYYGKKQGIK